jgi:hypothetical protein
MKKRMIRSSAEAVKAFKGKKVLCGATTADIIARELGLEIEDSLIFDDPELPPVSRMEGMDLVTEGNTDHHQGDAHSKRFFTFLCPRERDRPTGL